MEYWDIYDSSKQVTGRKMVRNDWHMKPGDYHLTVLALIRDAAGRILITQRKGDKEWAPMKWEIPGGGVRAGETSQEAVLREVATARPNRTISLWIFMNSGEILCRNR